VVQEGNSFRLSKTAHSTQLFIPLLQNASRKRKYRVGYRVCAGLKNLLPWNFKAVTLF
jgi:hypothetical protein